MKAKLLFILFIFFVTKVFSQTEFSQESAEKFLKVLASDIGPRPIGSPAERKAMKYALEKFKSFGCDTAFIQEVYNHNDINTTSGNVIGVKIGATNRVIVISGHLDSASPEVPGANDNASGSAVVLELARILSKRNNQSTLVFALFGGEEQGLAGSEAFINYLKFENFIIRRKNKNTTVLVLDSIVLMLNLDMASGLGDIEIDPHGKKYNAPKWLIKAAVEEFYKLGYKNLIYAVSAQTVNNSIQRTLSSDHEAFINNNIPAVSFTTDINTPIHTPQDNLENFDPGGLKRSGDLVLKLVERFDGGVPSRNVEEYWMILLSKFPIFFPIWLLKIFISFAFLISIVAVLLKRKKRLVIYNAPVIENSNESPPVYKGKFTGFKVLLLSTIPPLLGMFSFYLIGWLKKLNHPWFADPFPYCLNALLFLLLGFWLTLHIAKNISLSRCHYSFFLKSTAVSFILLAGAAYLDTKLAVYPATSLVLIALAGISKNQYLKILLLLLSPLPVLRLIFHEWFYFILRMFVLHRVEFPGQHSQLFVTAALVAFFILISFPFILAFGSVYRESTATQKIIGWFKSTKIFTTIIASIILMNLYLYMQPSYTKVWQKTVLVRQIFDLVQNKFTTTIRSPEYLNGITVKYQNKDTIINVLKTEIVLIEMDSLPIDLRKYNFEISGHYSDIENNEEEDNEGQVKMVNFKTNDKIKKLRLLILDLNTKHSPYKFNVSLRGYDYVFRKLYVSDANDVFTSYAGIGLKYEDNGITKVSMNFYSFPSVPLKIEFFFGFIPHIVSPVKFNLNVVYNTPLYPVELKRENTNFIFRSEIIKEEEF